MKKNSHIVIFSSFFPPEIGAASSRIYDMAKGLKSEGFEVTIVTGFPNYPKGKLYKGYSNKFLQKETMDGIAVRRHWVFPTHSDKAFLRLLNMLALTVSSLLSVPALLKKKPAIVFVQYPPMLLPFSAWLLARLTHAQYAVNISDIWPSAIQQLGHLKKGGLYNLLSKVEGFIYKKADFCLAQSEEIRNHISAKTQVPCLLYRTGADSSKIRRKTDYAVASPPFKIVYAGVLGVAHGMAALCEKVDFQALGCELHIFGDGFEKSKIETLLKKNEAKGTVLHNLIPNEELLELLPTFDAALISQKTRVYGTLPSKLYEAMGTGLPILFHGGGEGTGIVLKANCGFTSHPQQPEKLIENIQQLKNLPSSKRKKLGDNGCQSFAENFERKDQIKKLLHFLRKKTSPVQQPSFSK